MRAKPKDKPVGPCGAKPSCGRHCEGWEPHPMLADVWETCACGHSRSVHALVMPPPSPPRQPDPPPSEPARCACCGQLLPEETYV